MGTNASRSRIESSTKLLALLVEDEEAILGTLSLLLSSLGCDVREARSLDEFLAVLSRIDARSESLSLLVIDAETGGLQGSRILRALGEVREATPVILISGLGAERLASRAAAARDVFILKKPFDPASLEDVVRRALKRS